MQESEKMTCKHKTVQKREKTINDAHVYGNSYKLHHKEYNIHKIRQI